MFSDHLITIAGRTITSHDMLMMLVSVVTGLLFWTTLYFSRKRVVVLKRSSGTDQVTLESSRIADALERIANRTADDAIGSGIAAPKTNTTATAARIQRCGVFHVWALERRYGLIPNWTAMMRHG